MMPVFLAVLQLVVFIMIVVTAVLGWGTPATERVVTHMYWGVATALLGLFGHTLTLFFFIGTGKAIRLACRDQEVARPLIAESVRFRARIAGRSMIANLALLVQPVLGAAVYSGRLGEHWHYLGFWLTLGVQGWVMGTEWKLLGLNNVLLARVGEWKSTGRLEAPGTARAGETPDADA